MRPGAAPAIGGRVIIVALTPAGRELWRSDGTWSGTVSLRETTCGPRFPGPRTLVVSEAHVFSDVSERDTGSEPWALPRGTLACERTPGARVETGISPPPGGPARRVADIFPCTFGSFTGEEPWVPRREGASAP